MSKEVDLRVIGDATSQNWVCLTCGFESPLFPEVDIKGAKRLPDKPVNFAASRTPPVAGFGKSESALLLGIIITTLLAFLLSNLE